MKDERFKVKIVTTAGHYFSSLENNVRVKDTMGKNDNSAFRYLILKKAIKDKLIRNRNNREPIILTRKGIKIRNTLKKILEVVD